jgi:lysozyme
MAGMNLLKEVEGLRYRAYFDTGGVATIGYGHTKGVKPGMTCTAEQAEEWLEQDLLMAEASVGDLVKVPLTDNQFSALVSFTFNLGPTALANSTLLKLLNAGDYKAIPAQMVRWKYDNGRMILGLAHRRDLEAALWSKK